MVVLDTGALVRLEEGRVNDPLRQRWAAWVKADVGIVVPSAVVAELCRGRPNPRRSAVLRAAKVMDLTKEEAAALGQVLASCAKDGPGVVDGLVVALAARIGAEVYTGDQADILQIVNKGYAQVRVHALS